MNVCALSEEECGNPCPILHHIHISVVFSTSLLSARTLLRICFFVFSRCVHLIIFPKHSRWLKTERLTKQTFAHQPTYSSLMVAERRCDESDANQDVLEPAALSQLVSRLSDVKEINHGLHQEVTVGGLARGQPQARSR